MLGLGAEENMVAVHAAFEPTGLIQPFEVAGDRVAILLEVNSFGIEGPFQFFASMTQCPATLTGSRCSVGRSVCAAANTATKSSKDGEQIRDKLWRLIEHFSRWFNGSIPEPY